MIIPDAIGSSVPVPLWSVNAAKKMHIGVNIRERTWCGAQTDARMQRGREIWFASAGDGSALLVFSIRAVQYVINLPQVWG
jgi:hypothetical protein